jgi:RHS repeat-associated protein
MPSAIVFPDGARRQMTYNALGEVTSETDENGHVVTLDYDASGRLRRLTDGEGHSTVIGYDGSRPTSVADPLGHTTRYAYDDAGRLASTTDAQGLVHHYEYDAVNQLVRETDVLGRARTYTYDSIGNLITETINPTRRFEYDARGNVVKRIDGNDNATLFEYDALDRLIKETDARGGARRFGYDAVGNLTSYTDANGHTTSFTYDRLNRTTSQTDALGLVTRWTYDEFGNTRSVIDALGHTTTYEYDVKRDAFFQGAPNTIGAAYNSRLSAIVDPLGARTSFAYDAVGNIKSVIDANGHATNYGYDGRNLLTAVTDARGGVFHYGYDAVGNLVSSRDPLGRSTLYAYDSRNNLRSVTDPLGNIVSQSVDGVGNLTSVTDALGHTTRYQYNALNLVTAIDDALGHTTQVTYDNEGHVTQTIDPLGFASTLAYDGVYNIASSTDEAGNTSTFTYDFVGNLLTHADPLGRTLTHVYDEVNRLRASTNSLGQKLQFQYDAADNLLSLTDAAGNTTRYEYDAADQLIKETNALGHSRLTTYDGVGNLTSVLDRNGRARTFTFDELDRVIEEIWSTGGQTLREIDYTYDAVDNLLTASDPDSAFTLKYDNADRLLSIDNLGTPRLPRTLLTYGYDRAGNVTSIEDNWGAKVASAYDAANQLATRSWSGTDLDPVQVAFNYNAQGALTSLTRSAGVNGSTAVGSTSFDYDPIGRLTNLVHKNAANQDLVHYQYTYDAVGQLVGESHHGTATTYGYDPLGQLSSVSSTERPAESYAYAPGGNRANASTVVGPANQLLEDAEFRYGYDFEGNLVHKTSKASGNVTTYAFDHRNRLTAVEERDPSGGLIHQLAYTYDVFDRRIAQQVDGTYTAFAYSGDQAWADFDAAGRVTARYLHGDESMDFLLARQRAGESTSWYLLDHQDTVRDITNASGTVIDHITYDSFGNVLAETNPAAGDRFRFTGRENEPTTGLSYYRSRYYDPGPGRFISEDSWAFSAGDPNFYRYVANAPTNYTDPTGHVALLEMAIIDELITGAVTAIPPSCVMSLGANISMDLGDGYARYVEHNSPGFEFVAPFPSSEDLRIEVVSCAKLSATAKANAAFGVVGTVLAYVNLTASGQPIDCVDFESYRVTADDSDYYLKVRVACREGQNKVKFHDGLYLPIKPSLGLAAAASRGNGARSSGGRGSVSRFASGGERAIKSPGGVPRGPRAPRLPVGRQSPGVAPPAVPKRGCPSTPPKQIPETVFKTRDTIRITGKAPLGYKGGRTFRNDGRGKGEVLPNTNPDGSPITYKEYDVNPYSPGVNRGPERLVIGSDGHVYYTSDHYKTFRSIP